MLVDRKEEDVTAFMEKERTRWDIVYDEELPDPYDQEFYPGDRVEIVNDIKVKELDARGMQGTVVHFEFDDGFESCQTCSTACPLTVMLDA